MPAGWFRSEAVQSHSVWILESASFQRREKSRVGLTAPPSSTLIEHHDQLLAPDALRVAGWQLLRAIDAVLFPN